MLEYLVVILLLKTENVHFVARRVRIRILLLRCGITCSNSHTRDALHRTISLPPFASAYRGEGILDGELHCLNKLLYMKIRVKFEFTPLNCFLFHLAYNSL